MSELWRRLEGVDAYRITEIPHRTSFTSATDDSRESSGGTDTNDHGKGQRVAALAAAYHAGVATGDGVIGFGWIRPQPNGPVNVVAAGKALAGSAINSGEIMLALPGGARGRPLADLTELLASLPAWREIAGISDGLLNEEPRHPRLATSLDDVLLGSWVAPFGWLVIAEPVPLPDLRALADDTAARLHLTESTADRFPGRALDARRLKHRLVELRRAFSTGLWKTRLLAGGTDEVAAARVAGLFCASVDLGDLPYAIAPASHVPAGTSDAARAGAAPELTTPFCAATEFVAAVAAPPQAEIPGIRLVQRPEFDTTPEASTAGIPLGEIRDRNMMPAGTFSIGYDSLNRHVFVTGATGAGKSQTIRGLLERSAVPWLVIEPAKAEYRYLANRLERERDVIRIRPGEPDAIPAGINPLEPAPGFPLQTHADLTRALFVAAFRSEEPFPQVLSAALTRAYTQAGWDLALGEPVSDGARYPALADLQRAAEHVVAEIGYSQRVTDDVLGFMKVRLASLRHGTTGRFLAGGHPIDFEKLLTSNVVLEIEDVGDDRDKAFLMGTVLIRLAEHLRVRGQQDGLRHLTIVEEAHRLLRKSRDDGAAAHAVEMFASLLSELRAYGEGLIIADQIPARLVPDVIKNTAVKIAHRLPASDDRDAVGATMNLSAAQSRYLVTLAPGEAAVFTDGMDHPLLVKMQDHTERERARPPVTASAAAIVGRRGPACGADCVARPCTLRDMSNARRVLETSPAVRLWTELTVLAHLAGWPMPVPRLAILEDLRALPPRLRDCLISHAADEAISSRTGIPDAAGLAAHVSTALRCRVTRDMWLCPPDEPRWRREAVDKVASFGIAKPSVVERAVGALRTDATYGQRLADALEDFADCRWPLDYLSLRRFTEVDPAILDGGGVLEAGSSYLRPADLRRHEDAIAGLDRPDACRFRVDGGGTAHRVGRRVAIGALDRQRGGTDRRDGTPLQVESLVGTTGLTDGHLAVQHPAQAEAAPEAEPA